jgi:hypothetical protein
MHRRRTPVHAIISITFACSALLGIALVGLSASRASDNPAEKAWTAYAQAQRQWQQELAGFLSTQRTDLKEVIAASRDLQLALIDRRSFEFHYLLTTHPERIVTNQGISQFANFPWTDQDHRVESLQSRLRRGSKARRTSTSTQRQQSPVAHLARSQSESRDSAGLSENLRPLRAAPKNRRETPSRRPLISFCRRPCTFLRRSNCSF